jgi:CO/xanthine dehydrogenase FAD-binding subunit
MGLLEGSPLLRQLIEAQTAESVTLSTRCRNEIHTASFRALRGYTIVGAVLDEVAFWRSDDSANPDSEIVNAIRPATATVPGALLMGISSPYARRGVLWDMYRRYYGKPGDILDISVIKGLRGISEEGDKLRFGALTTWSDLRRAALPPAFDGYRAAAREVGGAQVQNRGTLVGNICTASPAGDGLPCLLTLDAEVELRSLNGCRSVPIGDFVSGYRKTVRRPDELVSAILVPRGEPSARGRFVKLGARRYLVISIAMAAAVLAADADGRIVKARVAIGACSPVAQRLPDLEAALVGCSLAHAADAVQAHQFAALSPIDDIRASAAYRQDAALAVVRDVLAGFMLEDERRAA